jgi:hypothetical protein
MLYTHFSFFLMRISYFRIIGGILLGCISLAVMDISAAPLSSPSSAPIGGYFSQYFHNLTTTPCAPGSILHNFNPDMTWQCRDFSELMKEYLTKYPAASSSQILQ